MARVFDLDSSKSSGASTTTICVSSKVGNTPGSFRFTDIPIATPIFRGLTAQFAQSNMVMTFEHDFPDVWQTLVDWAENRTWMSVINDNKPNRYDVGHLVRCWLLGHKLQIPQFQDGVMMFILLHTEDTTAVEQYPFSPVALDIIRQTGLDSEMSKLVIEEMAKCVYLHENEDIKPHTLTQLRKLTKKHDDFIGFEAKMTQVRDQYVRKPGEKVFAGRLFGGADEQQDTDRWKDFMVGDGRNLPFKPTTRVQRGVDEDLAFPVEEKDM